MGSLKWKQIDPRDFRRGLAREFGGGIDVETAQALSATGWMWDPATQAWMKNNHGITAEALEEIESMHPWAANWVMKMLQKGAVGFKFEIAETDDGRYMSTVTPEWPDVVTLLSEADRGPQETGLNLADII